MRALVTGGAGFVGSHIVEALVNAGHSVTVVDNLVTGSRANLRPDAAFAEVDITNRPELQAVFDRSKPEVVLHQAAQTLVAASSSDPIRDSEINVVGTLNVLDAAGRTGVKKVIFASSGGTVYGNPERQPVGETEPLRPISPYGVSKVAGEHYLRVICEQRGMAWTSLRYGNVYGPRDIPASQHVITAFLHAIARGSRPVIEWDGEQSKDYVYAADVAQANLFALDQGRQRGLQRGQRLRRSRSTTSSSWSASLPGLTRSRTISRSAPGTFGSSRWTVRRRNACSAGARRPAFRDGLRTTVDYYLGTRALDAATP